MKLKVKLTLPIAIILFISFLTLTFIILQMQYKTETIKMDKKVKTISKLLALTNVSNIWDYNEEGMAKNLESFLEYDEVVSIELFDDMEKSIIKKTKDGEKLDQEIKVEMEKDNSIIGYVKIGFTKKYIIEDIAKTRNIIIILSVLIFIIVVLAIYMMSNKLIKPIAGLVESFEKGVHGDLSSRVDIKTNDEIGKLGESYNEFMARIQGIILEINNGAQNILDSSKEINKANEELASKASTQASALEETSATMEEISSIVLSNTKTTSEANAMVKKTGEKAEGVGSLSINLKNSMSEISDSSKRIQNIIEVIDEIAFQTNLLALNAAVEAARAGEQGRGFAVVAVEIRNLAGRSSKAAKEIKELIKESVTRVDQGTTLVDTTIGNLDDIVNEVRKVSEVIDHITISAKEQQTGIEQINRAVSDLDEVTQTNAGIAEQTSASTQTLYENANSFFELISFFKIKKNDSEIKKEKDNLNKGIREIKKDIRKEERIEKPKYKPSIKNENIRKEPSKLIPFDDEIEEI